MVEEGWKTGHMFCKGRGNNWLKRVRRSKSVFQFHCDLLLNDRDISMRKLLVPAMCSDVSGELWMVLSLSVRARRSPTTHEPLAAMHHIQCTVGALLLSSAM